MTFGKASLLAVGFVGAVGLGVAIGMTVAERTPGTVPGFDAYMSAPPSPTGDDFGTVRRTASSRAATATAETAPVAKPAAAPSASATTAKAVDVSAPALQKRLKPLLSRGTNMTLAAEGFSDAHQFATLAHAAHNTQVPFVLLKHRVLVEGKSVASAIRELKPDADAAAEAAKAREEANTDLAEIAN
jgi:hypothetical protein